MRRLLLTHLVVVGAALAFTASAWADIVGDGATPPEITTALDPPPLPDGVTGAVPDPSGEITPPPSDPGSAPAGSTDPIPEPPTVTPAPPAQDPVPPLPVVEVPTTPPSDQVPIVAEPPPTLVESPPTVPLPSNPPPIVSDHPFLSDPPLMAGELMAALSSTLDSLRAARDQSLVRAQVAQNRGRAERHELRPALPDGLLRSGLPFREVGGSVSGAGTGGGASFSPDGYGARTVASLLLLVLMGAGLIVSTRATVPSSLVARVRLERPG